MHHAEKNKNVIYRLARSVLKNILSRSQKRPSAFGLGPFLRPRQNIFPVRTSHPVNNIYISEAQNMAQSSFSKVPGKQLFLRTSSESYNTCGLQMHFTQKRSDSIYNKINGTNVRELSTFKHSQFLDPVYMVLDPEGHDIKLNTFKTSVALKFMITLQYFTITNQRKSGRSKYDAN